jgi:D-alanyl-D-alanine carboxypeptidase
LFAIALAATLGFTPATAQRIDAIVGAEVRANRTPGIAVGVVESGRIIYARGFGDADISRNTRVSPATQFRIGQLSEEFTAAALLLLEQSGKVKLDDPVTAYLPNLTFARSVTLRELLDQTSGLPHVSDWAHLLKAASVARPLGPPGVAYDFNPLNYAIAAMVVERVSGIPLSDYVEQHIFVPLVMDSSLYVGETGLSGLHAIGYTERHGAFVKAQLWSSTRSEGDADVISNVYDLAKWDIEFPILLRVDAVREMFTPALPTSLDRHAMGWTIDQRDGRRFIWQNGEIPGYHVMNALLPDDHVAVIVLVNTDTFGGDATLPEEIAGRILDVLVPPTAQRVDNAVMARAREWLARLANGRIDRTELTPAFSQYLSDSVVRQAHIASYGPVISIIPIASTLATDGATEYEFLVRFAHGVRHYHLTIAADGRVAFISFSP